MGQLLTTVASNLAQPCLAIVDAYFAAATIFTMAKAVCRDNGERLLHIITRAKGNVVAREPHPGAYGGRGRPLKYGKKIRLKELFTSRVARLFAVGGHGLWRDEDAADTLSGPRLERTLVVCPRQGRRTDLHSDRFRFDHDARRNGQPLWPTLQN